MRRSVFSTIVISVLLLGACSERLTEVSPPERPESAGTASLVAGCSTTPTIGDVLTLVNQILPQSPLRSSVIALINALPSRFQDRLKTTVRRLIFPIQDLIIKAFYAGRLKGGKSAATFDAVIDLIEALYCYVGLTPPSFPSTTAGSGAGSDVVVRVVFPNTSDVIRVPSENAALTIPGPTATSPAAVTPAMGPVTIVMFDLPDEPPPLRTSLDQYPRFYHFSGTTADGPVTFAADVTGEICLRGPFTGDPANLRLAHNVGPDFGDVEVLPRPAVAPGNANCSNISSSGLSEGQGRFRWLEKLFLPAELHATSQGLVPLVGGQFRKFSEFGIVEIFSNPGAFSRVSPTSSTEAGGSTITRTVHVTSDNDTPIKGAPVTFSTSNGTLAGGSPQTVFTNENGNASVSWTLPPEPGTFTLTAQTPAKDNAPLGTKNPPAGNVASFPDVAFSPASLTFTVQPADEPLVLNLTTPEKLPGGTQHFFVQSGGAGPYVWSVNGVDGGNATFGTITTNADFTADYVAPEEVPDPATFDVCARRQANPLNSACASVTILPVPSSGQDVVVFNDVDFFSDAAGAPSNPNNQLMYRNLMEYVATGTRSGQNGILIHFGQQSKLWDNGGPAYVKGFIDFLTAEEYDVTVVDDPAALLGLIPSTIKVVVLVLPTLDYTAQQINTLKQFASQGGRIVFIGEHSDYYGVFIARVENPFFEDMGAQLTNVGALIDCGAVTLPQSSIREHQITAGMMNVSMGCASTMRLGPNDYGLITGTDGRFIAGVAKIDVTPLSITAAARLQARKALRETKPSLQPARNPLGSAYVPRPQR